MISGVAAVVAGVAVHALFAVSGLLPSGDRGSVTEMVTFAIDYTFWPNLVAVAVAIALVVLARQEPGRRDEAEAETEQAAGTARR